MPMILQWDESFDIGSDTDRRERCGLFSRRSPSPAHSNKLTVKVDRPELSPADIKKLQDAQAAAGDNK